MKMDDSIERARHSLDPRQFMDMRASTLPSGGTRVREFISAASIRSAGIAGGGRTAHNWLENIHPRRLSGA
jgi:hypothetical protein